MRNISQHTLDLLMNNKQGLEPINIVDIQWTKNGSFFHYADRNIPEFGVLGKILELGELESVVNVGGGSFSGTVKIKLDDTDGTIKNIFNNNDIHHRVVKIYQWFGGINLPITDAFILFVGLISSPITWNEGDHTFSFDVLSKLEDLEVGFSPEEGDFEFVTDKLIGKMWPLVFGLVKYVPALMASDIPRGILKSTTVITNKECQDQKEGQLASDSTAAKARDLAKIWFLRAIQEGQIASDLQFEGDTDAANQHLKLEEQYTDRGNQFLFEANKIGAQGLAAFQKECIPGQDLSKTNVNIGCGKDFGTVPVNGQLQSIGASSPGTITTLRAGSAAGGDISGSFDGETFNIIGATHPNQINPLGDLTVFSDGIAGPLSVDDRQVVTEYDHIKYAGLYGGVFPLNAGTPLLINGDFQVDYIVAGVIPVYVLGVYAKKKIRGVNPDILWPVPITYYTVKQIQFNSPEVQPGINATVISLRRPLSSTFGEEWHDEIFCNLLSPIGPNIVDILIWLIKNYSTDTYDAVSFNHVRSKVDPFPANFALFQRKPITTLLKDIAFQARCALWLDDGIFYIKYLPEEPTSIDTITESDVETKTLEIESTTTEDLTTKMIIDWKPDYSGKHQYEVILRNNISKYGLHEKRFDFFIYNTIDLVTFAATFWLIRYSNVWKRVKFKTFLYKLKLETFDTVLLNFSSNYISSVPVKGLIESDHYDSNDHTISLEIWTPLRLGDMKPHPGAWPANINVTDIFPFNIDVIKQEKPKAVGGNIGVGLLCSAGGGGTNHTKSHIQPYDRGLGPIADASQNLNGQIISSVTDSPDIFIPQQANNTTATPTTTTTNIQPNLTNSPPNIDVSSDTGFVGIPLNDPIFGNINVKVDAQDANTLLIINGPNQQLYKGGTPIKAPVPTNPIFSPISNVVTTPITHRQYKLKEFEPGKVDETTASAFPGLVISKISDNQYNVNVFLKGLTGSATPIVATQLQIDSTETIPTNTSCIVTKIPAKQGFEWDFQVPVWLA